MQIVCAQIAPKLCPDCAQLSLHRHQVRSDSGSLSVFSV